MERPFSIETRNLVKVYRGRRRTPPVRALDGLTLGVRQGEIFGLLGRNGAGKTTLLRILTTLARPTSGGAFIQGINVESEPQRVRQAICAVLQENAVEIFLSVADNLATYARFHSIPRVLVHQRITRVLELFGLTEVRHQKVIDLSGGLKRRVQVAKVFMVDRPVVFLDEATTGMDPINKRATMEAIREEAGRGRTILLTTQVLQEAEELCDQIAIIDRGKVIVQGDLPTIRALSSRAFDLSITFASLTEALLEELQRLPLLKFAHKHTTVELCVKAKELSALEILSTLARRHQILHFEVSSATLEDVFLELLGARDREDQTP
jgi:ABC-2 type transport system ATP-binding protein